MLQLAFRVSTSATVVGVTLAEQTARGLPPRTSPCFSRLQVTRRKTPARAVPARARYTVSAAGGDTKPAMPSKGWESMWAAVQPCTLNTKTWTRNP